MMYDVFVYGTLKKDYWNNPWMSGHTPAVFMGVKETANKTFGLWSNLPDCIPFVYNKPEGGSAIQGEHWTVDEVGITLIRYLEHGYDETEVLLTDGTKAAMFIYRADDLPIGSSGIDFPPRDGAISWPLTHEDKVST